MNFCSQCGGQIERRVPAGDNRERDVCPQCGFIHYQNPKVIVGCLPVYQNKVLLCRRAIDPRYGLWTLPAGFMELGETTRQGAERETWEEARATVSNLELYSVFNLPHIGQVYCIFRSELEKPEFSPGEESLEVALFEEEEIPWDELAFMTISRTLKHYFQDRKRGDFPVRMEDIEPSVKPKC
ncbi:NUDIX hydrolase [Endozoicomonadaceae bacterium StTr2]